MMGRSRFSDPEKRSARTALIICVVIALGLFFSPWIHDVAVSVLRLRGDGGGSYATLPRAVLIERLRTAEDELSDIRYQAVHYTTLARQYTDLAQEVKLRSHEAHMTARVLVTPPRSHYDTLVLFAGSEDGVLVNDIAMIGGVALGIVTEVHLYSSLVELYSAPGNESDARFESQDATVVVTGVGGGALEARVPDELVIAVGDTVIDPRTGYVFGTVQSVVTRDIDTEQYVRIALPSALTDLTYVSLVHRVE